MGVIRTFRVSINQLWNSREALKLSNARVKYLPYIFAFPLSLIFISVKNTLFTVNFNIFGFSSNTIVMIGFAVGATVVLIIRSAENVHIISKITSIITFAGFLPWLFVRNEGSLDFIFTVVFMAGVGGCMSVSGTHFMLLLNNTERFFACAFMTIMINIINVNFALVERLEPIRVSTLSILVIGIAVCMFLTKKEDFHDDKKTTKGFDPSVWLSLFILLSYFICRILTFSLPEFKIVLSLPLRNIYIVGVVLLCFVITLVFRRSVWIMCNLFLISAVLAYIMIITENTSAAYFFISLKEVGLFVGFYLCACVVNKFLDFRRHKVMEFICISTIAIVFVIPDILINSQLSYAVPIAVSAVLLIAFLIMSPLFTTYLFTVEWAQDFARLHMSEIKAQVTLSQTEDISLLPDEKTDLLTPGEVAVAMLLIEGKTRSEITRKLHIKAADFDGRMESIRKKISGKRSLDRGIVDLVAEFKLTKREADMLNYLRDGFTTEQIASGLYISEETVRYHIGNLVKKLGLEKRRDIVAWLDARLMEYQ